MHKYVGKAKPIMNKGGEVQNYKNMYLKELNIVEEEEEGEYSEPVSPLGQYFNSSVLSVYVLGVLEFQIPIDHIPLLPLLKDVFLPINHRFSSIMVEDDNGIKQWKKVEVNLEDHVIVPTFPPGLSPDSYGNHLSDYLTKIAMERLPHDQPLWNIHMIKYPTTNAPGTAIFKLHHALGDGYSLMGALLSCFQRADDPSIPLTFPSRSSARYRNRSIDVGDNIFRNIFRVMSSVFNTIWDCGWSLLKSNYVEDEKSSIRSGIRGVEFKPVVISTMTFSLDQIKQIKTKLGVTVNDVITGVIFLGTRLYMQGNTVGGSTEPNNERSTAVVLFNTRNSREYKSVEEMVRPGGEKIWGNQIAFLHIALPELTAFESQNPLEFVRKAHQLIQRKRNSGVVFLTARLLEFFRKYRGPEETAKYIYGTINKCSMSITSMIGPVEQMAFYDHPVKSFYFMPVGPPQSLIITMVSYMGELRVAVGTEKDYIDEHKFKSCIQNAFQMILNAAQEVA